MRISYHLLLVLLIMLLNGCSMVSYYGQSIKGQLSILYNREAINTIINDADKEPALKTKLTQVKQIRRYASDALFLPDNKSYLYYTNLHRPYVVWNVFSAPEFSLKPITWCYPIVGCVSYRGYFDESNALNYANNLTAEGNDTHVAGIAAYSTLGWFNDPVLSSMINWHERALAGLIFHELSHQVIYIKNETAFNEAFSSAVERIGSIQWLLEFHPDQVHRYLAYLDAQNDFRNLLSTTRDKLSGLYAEKLSAEDKRQRKDILINEMRSSYSEIKQNWPNGIHFDAWFDKPINNARFTSSMTYLQKIPAFYTLFLEADGKWPDFYDRIKQLGNLTVEERNQVISTRLDRDFDLQKIVDLLKK